MQKNIIDFLEIMKAKDFVVTQGSAIKVLTGTHNLHKNSEVQQNLKDFLDRVKTKKLFSSELTEAFMQLQQLAYICTYKKSIPEVNLMIKTLFSFYSVFIGKDN